MGIESTKPYREYEELPYFLPMSLIFLPFTIGLRQELLFAAIKTKKQTQKAMDDHIREVVSKIEVKCGGAGLPRLQRVLAPFGVLCPHRPY